MKLTVKRRWFTDKTTIGELYIDGQRECFTLEDRVRLTGPKVPGETAIPYGTYPVKITFSNRFQKPLPLVENVPNFEGIRIHAGNTDKDTHGCILLGTTREGERIGNSRLACGIVQEKIKHALNSGAHVSIEIVDGRDQIA